MALRVVNLHQTKITGGGAFHVLAQFKSCLMKTKKFDQEGWVYGWNNV